MKHIIFAAGLALTLAYPAQAADKPADKKPAAEKKAEKKEKKKHKKAEGTKVPEAAPAKKDDKKKK